MDAQLQLKLLTVCGCGTVPGLMRSFTTMSDGLLSDQPFLLISDVYSLWFINHLNVFILQLSVKVFRRFVKYCRLDT